MTNQLNRQEVFNTVKDHLLTQGRKSLAANGVSCMYRGLDGAMCGIGPLIKDKFYDKGLEGNGVGADVVMEALCSSMGLPDVCEHSVFLDDLQNVHDICDVEHWPQALQVVASDYGLDYD